MDLCRLCGDTLGGGRSRDKTVIAESVLQNFNIDFKNDNPTAPTHIHNKCYMSIKRGSFSGDINTFVCRWKGFYLIFYFFKNYLLIINM